VNRLFLDSNVLFTAAHNPGGKAATVVWLAAEGLWHVVSSEHAVEEARRNLARKYPQALDRLALLLQAVRVVRQSPPPAADADVDLIRSRARLPPKDQVILDAALGCRATHLLTGDTHHFGALLERPDLVGGLMVQTVAGFLADRTPRG
jgi:uncharacterized protein